MDNRAVTSLMDDPSKIPAIHEQIGFGSNSKDFWWVKFGLDLDHPVAWHVV